MGLVLIGMTLACFLIFPFIVEKYHIFMLFLTFFYTNLIICI